MYPLNSSIEKAFELSDVLVVEADEAQADQVKMQKILMSRGFYPGAETIQNHVSKDTFNLLQESLNSAGIPYSTIAKMRPGLIAITLTVAKIAQLGYSPDMGIDRYFIKKARGKKPIQQLETPQAQMDLLLSFSDDDLVLKHTLISLHELEKMFAELSQAWKNGNEKQMERLMLTEQLEQYPEFADIIKRMFDDRNVSMALNIQHLLESDKTYFVVVGAGHLIGENGIVALLKKQGFTVERL